MHTIAANIEFTKLINPDNDKELLLGGESGLRGYSVREFSGNKKLFISVEDRLFLKDDLWELISVGGALFYDAGMVWKKDEVVGLRGIKSDIGIGLRFGISRSSASEVIRVDIAYALNGSSADKRWVLTIKSGQIFNPKGIGDFRSEN
jgi:hemolysin activation/secretion protein